MKNLLLNPPLEWIGIGLSFVMLIALITTIVAKRFGLGGLFAATGGINMAAAFDLTRLEDANTPLNPFSHTFFPSPAMAYWAMMASAVVLGIAGICVMVLKQLPLAWFVLTLGLATLLVSGGLGRAWRPLDTGWDLLNPIFMVLTALMTIVTVVSVVRARRRKTTHLQVV